MKKVLLKVVKKPEPPTEEPQISNKMRTDWNSFVDWMDKRGLKGSPELDKNGLGFKMIEEYRKINPTTTITKESIIPIQKEFQKSRQWTIDEIKAGKAAFAPGVNENNFLSQLSIIDGIPGQRTTSYKFPEKYLTTFVNGKNLGTVNEGYVESKK